MHKDLFHADLNIILMKTIKSNQLKLQGENPGRKGQLAIATEVFEVTPSLYMVEIRKSNGDTLEFHNF